MVLLLAVGFLAGLVTGLSPCALPVLPALAGAGAAGPGRWRPLAIVSGMVVTFSAATLAGSTLLSLLGLPQDLLRDMGIAALFILGAGLVFPWLGRLVERPFARLGPGRERHPANAVLLGASLGLVFVPCAGPVLAAITVVAASHRVGLGTVAITLCYAAGTAIPLLLVSYLALKTGTKARQVRRHAHRSRQLAGALIIASAALVVSGAAAPLQRDLPGYVNSLDGRLEGSSNVAAQLRHLTGERAHVPSDRAGPGLPDAANPVLTDYGSAPRLLDITDWVNTPGDRPLAANALKGKVVLVDFWTYSCINCQRAIPHLEAWYRKYSPYGLEVIGVHTPEFAFERVVGNVRRAVKSFGITYPVAVDDRYMTWISFGNEQWPEEYLVDQTGQLRYIQAGEGDYGETESLIRDLLSVDVPWLPPPTQVADLTPREVLSPETYLGWPGLQLYTGTHIVLDKVLDYHFGAHVPLDYVSFDGYWDNTGAFALSGKGAELRLDYHAKDVYLVLGGHGVITLSLDGRRLGTVRVSGYPRLYTMVKMPRPVTAMLQLSMTPGLSAYDFTFG
ncbi:MAG TPA: cytochrome c biogenesis protein CcdA [Acidimicrobiales bacterium]|nr:cytochrome c biogenesis protein CcdA [Acidimicrobiales bacterium]